LIDVIAETSTVDGGAVDSAVGEQTRCVGHRYVRLGPVGRNGGLEVPEVAAALPE
jgi:hypothetical protein